MHHWLGSALNQADQSIFVTEITLDSVPETLNSYHSEVENINVSLP